MDSTSAEVKKIFIKGEKSDSSSSHATTVIHSGDLELHSLIKEKAVVPANSDAEVILNEERPAPEGSVDKTRSIFNRFCCCCRK
ncbi:MAG: hypothetical protein C5B45_02225 [Chlamydiae bacterium]|nr:MAG: hypothetical protein C5B45_02225 [Chlamydiota bacterium]